MKQSQVLVAQGPDIVTVNYGQVPVLNCTSSGPGWIAMAFNFLRSGSPRVQLVWDCGNGANWEVAVREYVDLLRLPSEEVVVTRGNQNALWDTSRGPFLLVLSAAIGI